jgi:beta-N-acetylhexosaminidase
MLRILFICLLTNQLTAYAAQPAYESVDGSWARKTLASLTLREKIGQLFIVPVVSCMDQPEEALASSLAKCPYNFDKDYIKKLITDYKVGGLIFLYKSTPALQIDAINEYQKLSKLPLLIGQDGEWGMSMRLYETLRFPRNMTLGALTDKSLIYALGKEIGRQCRLLGVHINFAPVVDVNNNRNNPVIHDRSFGEDPQAVATAGSLMMSGLQDAGVLACAKHFPGHGDTSVDSHLDLPVIAHSKKRLLELECMPFKALIGQGVCGIMSAHLAIPALEQDAHRASSLSCSIVTDLLQHELGFSGLKVTDGIGMQALTNHFSPGFIELEAFLAGNDIILCPLDAPKAIELIEKAIQEGKVSEADLDARVLKVLKAKEWSGCYKFKPINKKLALTKLSNRSAEQLKRQLYEQAVTVMPNRSFTPITKSGAIAVVQVAGLEGEFKNQLIKYIDGYFYQPAVGVNNGAGLLAQLQPYETVVIALFGMNKFSTQNYGISASTQELIRALQAVHKKVIYVLFGTPYSVALLDKHSPVIIAYEDDPDAQRAAADVLLGRRQATGTCPVTVNPKFT